MEIIIMIAVIIVISLLILIVFSVSKSPVAVDLTSKDPMAFKLTSKDPMDFKLTPNSKMWHTEKYCPQCKAKTNHYDRMAHLCSTCGYFASFVVFSISKRAYREIWVDGYWMIQYKYGNTINDYEIRKNYHHSVHNSTQKEVQHVGCYK